MTETELSSLVFHGGKLWKPDNNNPLFVGYVPIAEIKTSLTAAYVGPRISLELWQQILAFFKFSYDKYKSESQVRLFLNPELKIWAAEALPQTARGGMTTKELADHPRKELILGKYTAASGWYQCGTAHHHCTATAFQSGTDKNDEYQQQGIHITVGKIDKDEHDLHMRFVYKQVQYDKPDPSMWFDLPTLPFVTSADVRQKIHTLLLSSASAEDVTFPQDWADNLIEVTYPQNQHGFSTAGVRPSPANVAASGYNDWRYTKEKEQTPIGFVNAAERWAKEQAEKMMEGEGGSIISDASSSAALRMEFSTSQLDKLAQAEIAVARFFKEKKMSLSGFQVQYALAEGHYEKLPPDMKMMFVELNKMLRAFGVKLEDLMSSISGP